METKSYFPGISFLDLGILPKVTPRQLLSMLLSPLVPLLRGCGFKGIDFKYKPLACRKRSSVTLGAIFQ